MKNLFKKYIWFVTLTQDIELDKVFIEDVQQIHKFLGNAKKSWTII